MAPDELPLHFVNTLRPRQNGHLIPVDIFKRIFLNENIWISISISVKFFLNSPINSIPALVQIMAWRRPGGKPLSEPMMVSLLTYIHIHIYIYVCVCVSLGLTELIQVNKIWPQMRCWLNVVLYSSIEIDYFFEWNRRVVIFGDTSGVPISATSCASVPGDKVCIITNSWLTGNAFLDNFETVSSENQPLQCISMITHLSWDLLRFVLPCSLQSRHNERDDVSNHRRLHCLLNR